MPDGPFRVGDQTGQPLAFQQNTSRICRPPKSSTLNLLAIAGAVNHLPAPARAREGARPRRWHDHATPQKQEESEGRNKKRKGDAEQCWRRCEAGRIFKTVEARFLNNAHPQSKVRQMSRMGHSIARSLSSAGAPGHCAHSVTLRAMARWPRPAGSN